MIPSFLRPSRVGADQQTVIEFSGTIEGSSRTANYLEALRLIQPSYAPDAEREPVLVFELVDSRVSKLLSSLETADQPIASAHFQQLTDEEVQRARDGFCAGMSILRSYDSELPNIVRGLVGTWVFARNAEMDGGSFWFALGTVWLAPSATWTDLTYAENILHESTHQATFLADMVHGVFKGDTAARASALARSPIRRVPRRYDFAFHAAAVAAVLADFHQSVGDKARASELNEGISLSLADLRKQDHMLEPSGKLLLAELSEYVSSAEAVM